MTRVAGALILLSQVILLILVLEPTGQSAILFSFVGAPILAVGVLLAVVALARRLRAGDSP